MCGSELHIWAGRHPSKKRGGIGHEMVGRVSLVGDGVVSDSAGVKIKTGDRIVATYFQTCLQCPPCVGGQYNLCDNAYAFFGKQPEEQPHFHTAFSTHILIHPRQNFYVVPNNIPDKVAASANCALSQVYFGIDSVAAKFGDTMVIQGAGGLGLMGVALAKERGIKTIVIDSVKARLLLAQKFGADEVVDMSEFSSAEMRIDRVKELTNGLGADVGMEVVGVPEAFNEGVTGLVRRGGSYLVMGNLSPGFKIDFDPGLLTRRAVRVVPVDRYDARYLKLALNFLSKNIEKYPFEDLLDADFTLDEVKDALVKSVKREVSRASLIVSKH